MELIKANWEWIASNPWGFASFAALLFGTGWGLAKLFYNERIELLKTRATSLDKLAVSRDPVKAYLYKSSGRHGRNVLADTTHDATVGDQMSFQAMVPDGGKLHVVLNGPPPMYLSDASAAWSFSVVGVINWTRSTYQETTSGSAQHFYAEEGAADMQFFFGRTGEVRIEAFEGDRRTPAWSKSVHVAEKRGT